MEYGRRRKKRTGYARGQGSGSGFIQAVILLLVFGALGYMIFGTGLGTKLRDRYAVSLYDRLKGHTQSTQAPGNFPTVTSVPTEAPSPVPTGETLRISLPAVEAYMLQMGIFSDAESALKLADSLKAMGAAGYIYDDGGSLRLIAAAYGDEASAESVRARLASEGYETSVFRFSRSGVDLLVTAGSGMLVPIKTAFALSSDILKQLDELAIDFDASGRSVEYGLGVLSEMRTNAANACAGIAEAKDRSRMLSYLSVYLNDISSMLTEASQNASDRTAFASSLKAVRIKAAVRYADLLSNIGGEAQ
ncbi:MAG: SPOR domain-containing protein [Clostridiales bacterium]|nr:SPOR domain-containing protein [Clostridiales bacterium]